MKKKIKLFILGILITVFGLYFISNKTIANASTHYENIPLDELTYSYSSMDVNTTNAIVSSGITLEAFSEPCTLYKPTELRWLRTYANRYANFNMASLWTKYQSRIIVKSTSGTYPKIEISTNFSATSGGSQLRVNSVQVIKDITLQQFFSYQGEPHPALTWTNEEIDILALDTRSASFNYKGAEKELYILITLQEVDYRGVELSSTIQDSEGQNITALNQCYLLAHISLGSTNIEDNGKYVVSSPLNIKYCKIAKYDETGNNTITNETSYGKDGTTINKEGKYRVTKYAYESTSVVDKIIYIYYISNKSIKIYDTNDNLINTTCLPTNPDYFISNNPNIKLKFETSLHTNYLKEIIDKISFIYNDSSLNQNYSSTTKNNIISGNPIAIIPNQEIICRIDSNVFFSNYTFKTDTIAPTFELQPKNDNQKIVSVNEEAQTYLTGNSVVVKWTNPYCSLYINGNQTTFSEYTSENSEENYFYYNISKTDGTFNIELKDLAGNISKKTLYIKQIPFLTGEINTNNIYLSEIQNHYFQSIKLDAKTYYNFEDINNTTEQPCNSNQPIEIAYTMLIKKDDSQAIEYTPNTLIEEEGNYKLIVKYNLGYSFECSFVIDNTTPYMNKEYLQQQGYNQELCWYNTEDENGVTYSFSYYDSNESQKIGVYQYSLKREQTYFTLIIPYSSNWRTSSLPTDTSFKNINQINLDTISTYDTYDENNSDGYIYIYKNPSTNGYVAYFRRTNYQNALQKIVEKNITPQYKFNSNTYNPYPDSKYQYYLTYSDNNIDYPLFYLNSEYNFAKAQQEVSSINYEIYNASTNELIFTGSNPKINKKGLYKIIEIDLAGNSTIYFLSYNDETPYAEIINSIDNSLITTEEKNLKAPFIVKPGISSNYYNSSWYSIISYKYNGEQYYYNCYDNLTNTYNPLVCSNDGIYEFTIYSIYTNHSIKYTVKLYQKEIMDEIDIVLDSEEDPIGLLVKFSLEDAIQSKQITQINIFKDNNQLYGSTDTNGKEIQITSSNEYEFYFTANGTYQIEIIELCGHKISKEFELSIGSPSGFIYKNILDSNGVHEEKSLEKYVFHNNIVYFRWNPNKTSYSASIINLKTSSSSVYTNGEKIQAEGEYKIILINGDNPDLNQEYFITIDKTAPTGFIIDSLKTNESGFILDNNGNVTTQKIASNNYISGNRDGIKLSCLEPDVKAKLLLGYTSAGEPIYNDDFELDTYLKGTLDAETIYTIVLYDKAKNETQYNLKLDYKMAEITILCGSKQISNNSYVNQAFRFVCDEEVKITDLSNNSTIPLNKKISYEFTDKIMEYNFSIEDSYNNIAYYTIYFDNTTPMIRLEHLSTDGTITEINSKATINNAFIISWNESKNYTVTISYTNEYGFQQIPISNGDVINTELNPSSLKLNDKKYTITVTNLAGTEQIYYVYLCNTFLGCSVYSGTKLQDSTIKEFITNQPVKFIFYDATATINGNEYKSNTKIEEDGVYELQITDIYNNSYIYTFTIDTLPASVEIISTTNIIENGTNGDVILNLEEDAKIYLLSNESKTEYPKDFIYSNEGIYKFEIIDKANNITNISFVIDKTAPTFEVTGFTTNPNVTKENVKFTWDEPNVKATINGNAYKSNTKIEEDGIYEFILSDIYGNQAIFNFEIDSKMIEYTLHGINEQLYSNDYAYIDFDNSKLKAKIIYEAEEKDYFSETLIDEGEYKIILISKEIPDKKVEISFVIDKTAPTLELKTISSTGFIFENDSYYTNNTFTASYDSTQNTCSIDNGSTTIEYLSDKQIKEPGNYKLTLTDLAGNSTIYFVIIDKSDISFNLLNENNENLNYKLNETSATTQANYYNTSIKLALPEGSKATIDNQDYISDTLITAEGEYTLNLTNKLGTVSTFKFIIDKTAPVINLNVNSEFKTCDSVKIIVEEKNNYELYINDVKKTYYTITDNGTYNIICKDVAGNKSEVSFEILNRNLKDYISLEQDESLYTINLKIEELEDVAIYIDNIEVESLDSYTIPGKHQLEIKDAYGNSFKTTFTINEPTAPSYIFNNVMTYVLIGLISILIIVFIIRKTKSSKKNPYFKG